MKKFLLLCLLSFSLFASELTLPTGTETDEQILSTLTDLFKGKTDDSYKRSIKRAGNNTILFESFISMEADHKLAPTILSDISKYNDWALTNINKSQSGNLNYLLKIYSLSVEPSAPNTVIAEFMVDLPAFRKLTNRKFDVKTEQKGSVFTINAETPADPKSHIEKAICQLKLFPAPQPGRVWLYVTAKVKLKYWLLYEALPTRVLERESMERIQTVLDNYQIEEARFKKK